MRNDLKKKGKHELLIERIQTLSSDIAFLKKERKKTLQELQGHLKKPLSMQEIKILLKKINVK